MSESRVQVVTASNLMCHLQNVICVAGALVTKVNNIGAAIKDPVAT